MPIHLHSGSNLLYYDDADSAHVVNAVVVAIETHSVENLLYAYLKMVYRM